MATDLTSLLGGGGGIKNVQRGVVTAASNITNVTISAVDLSKSFVTFTMYSYVNGAYYYQTRVRLTSATNLEFQINSFSNSLFYAWEVVEFA